MVQALNRDRSALDSLHVNDGAMDEKGYAKSHGNMKFADVPR